jgi:hypothetical protein
MLLHSDIRNAYEKGNKEQFINLWIVIQLISTCDKLFIRFFLKPPENIF